MTKTITMDINHAVQLGMRSAKIEMKAGMGWVTVDERDHFIPEGESLEIEATVFPIVVSAVKNNQRIVFTENAPKAPCCSYGDVGSKGC